MSSIDFANIFDQGTLNKIFPSDRADQFFEALFGDASEGAYNISLKYKGQHNPNTLEFELHLSQRQNCCLVCSLTYGLPEVFSRHPIINIKGIVKEIEACLDGKYQCNDWQLARTNSISDALHTIPLLVTITPTTT